MSGEMDRRPTRLLVRSYGAVSPNRTLACGSIFLIHFQALAYILW